VPDRDNGHWRVRRRRRLPTHRAACREPRSRDTPSDRYRGVTRRPTIARHDDLHGQNRWRTRCARSFDIGRNSGRPSLLGAAALGFGRGHRDGRGHPGRSCCDRLGARSHRDHTREPRTGHRRDGRCGAGPADPSHGAARRSVEPHARRARHTTSRISRAHSPTPVAPARRCAGTRDRSSPSSRRLTELGDSAHVGRVRRGGR
jgi:hypothetical protein